MTLSKLMIKLSNDGCFPSIYRRGVYWRAHVNAAGNYWHDDSTPLRAMQGAVKLWRAAGKPMDGMAASVVALAPKGKKLNA